MTLKHRAKEVVTGKRLPHGNCAFCDEQRGMSSVWGMSPEGWANMKDNHDAGHPEYTESPELLKQ